MNIKKVWAYAYCISGIHPHLDRFLNFYMEKRLFFKSNGYKLNLKNPKTFNEKVIYKKLFDRNPFLPRSADKQEIKEILMNKFGVEHADKYIVPTIYFGNNIDNIPFSSLPIEYIIKGCQLSGYGFIKTKNCKFSTEEIIRHCQFILKLDISKYSHEWLYSKIQKNIIIEPLIRDESGSIPKDYKFFCFKGKVKLFQVDFNRFNGLRRSLFNDQGEYISGSIKYSNGEKHHEIQNLVEVIKFVESISFNLDFVRVDIFIINNCPIFSELTHYPGAGFAKIRPFELDVLLGDFWEIKYD